jgi:hypothetical protein
MPFDPTRYPPDWRQISIRIRAHRAKWCCEWCGAKHGLPHPDTGSKVVLTVAHLGVLPLLMVDNSVQRFLTI